MAINEKQNRQIKKQATNKLDVKCVDMPRGHTFLVLFSHSAGLRRKVVLYCFDSRLPIYRPVLFAQKRFDGGEALLAQRNQVCTNIKNVEREKEGSKR
jgi:hypothetical protein